MRNKLSKIEIVYSSINKEKHMKYREFTLTEKGLLIARFLHVLFDDMDFDSNEPMTDTYIQEVCYAARFNRYETLTIIDELVRMGIVK
jgi:hypothetical protein